MDTEFEPHKIVEVGIKIGTGRDLAVRSPSVYVDEVIW